MNSSMKLLIVGVHHFYKIQQTLEQLELKLEVFIFAPKLQSWLVLYCLQQVEAKWDVEEMLQGRHLP